jgi:creatinine amidohydrolase
LDHVTFFFLRIRNFSVQVHPDHSTDWSALTYGEIRGVATEDGSIVVIPVGSIEQHGHHLPVSTDTLLVDAVVRESVEEATHEQPVLATPSVWTGYSPHHMEFGGTLSVQRETLLAILSDVADAAIDNGFDACLLVNGHGGNRPALGSAVSEIGENHPDVSVSGLTYFELAGDFIDDIRQSDVGGMAHGGEFETSLMLHCYPELVRNDRLEGTMMDDPADRGPRDLFAAGQLSTYRPFEEYSGSGAIGAPESASAETGAQLFERLVTELVDILEEIHERTK